MLEFIRLGSGAPHKISLDVMGAICIQEVNINYSKGATMIHTILGKFYVEGEYEEVKKAVARRRQQAA